MKRLFITTLIAASITMSASAQEAAKPTMDAKPAMSKEEKAKQKQKAEEDLNAAIKEAGLTDEEAKQAKAIMEEGRAKRSEIKKSAISDEEKASKAKESNAEDKEKLTKLLGAKYKTLKDIQKKQKEAAATMQ